MKIVAVIALCFLLFVMVVPAHAALTPLVQCSTSTAPDACTMCDIFKLLKRIIDYVAFTLVPIIAGLLVLMAGFYIILGAASPEMVSTGKKMLTNTLIGIVIIYGSWMVTNFILKSLAGENPLTSSWFVIECIPPNINVSGTIPPVPTSSLDPLCGNKPALAAKYREPATPTNAPELNTLMNCIRSKMGGNPNLGSVNTFDHDFPDCNLTRGQTVCSLVCSHAINSCHYGGAKGTTGALAVDYGNEGIGDAIIHAANVCGATGFHARCENAAGDFKACNDPQATHVHVSAPTCDRN